ncbi:MAG TPA: hypothetical protein VIB99_04095 [Candidatus Limnocylindrales bacterium]|jgi:hypothetical protein
MVDREPDSGTVIVVTGDDDRFAAARRKAAELARAGHQALILYDWDAPTLFGDPLPTWWSGEGSEGMFSRRLDETHLRAAGRATIAEQVAEAHRAGVETFGWLPSEHGPASLAAYAREQGAATIVVSAALKDVGGLEALLDGTSQPADTVAARSPAMVVIVEEPDPPAAH